MAVTLSRFFYKIVLTATHSLLVLMKALSFALVVTNQEQVKLMMLHVVCELRLVNEGVGSTINCTGYMYFSFFIQIQIQLLRLNKLHSPSSKCMSWPHKLFILCITPSGLWPTLFHHAMQHFSKHWISNKQQFDQVILRQQSISNKCFPIKHQNDLRVSCR